MKLITPPGMLVTVALLAIYSAYAFLIGSIEQSLLLKAAGVAAVIGTFGVAMVRPWSQFLVYALTVGFIVKLGVSMAQGIESGFYRVQYGSIVPIARSLAPSLAMAVLSAICCMLVYRQFRKPPERARCTRRKRVRSA